MYSRMAVAASDEVDLTKLNVQFNLNSVVCYNVVNLGRFVLVSFEKTFNFCCELKVLNISRKCCKCRRELKLSHDRRGEHTCPVVFRCTNSSCRKQYYSITDGAFFDKSNLSLEQLLTVC